VEKSKWLKEAASISDYLESRQYNKKSYQRLLDNLQTIEDAHKEEFPGLHLEIGMSAKYQTPYVKIETEAGDYSNIGPILDDVANAVNEDFSVKDEEEKSYGYLLHFAD